MMKAVRIHRYGHSDQLKVEEIERPELRVGEVLVRICDAGVNPVDWKIREGEVQDKFPVDFPVTIGQDFAGEIIEIGRSTQAFQIGDEVYGFATGAYAEMANVSVNEIALKPRSIDFATAAAIPTAGLTAWQCIVDIGRVSRGQTVLIHGAGGGVGSFAVQIARSQGARVIATAASEDHDYLRSINVDQIIDYKEDDFEDLVSGVDCVLDTIGGRTQEYSFGVLKRGGIIASTVGGLDEKRLSTLGLRGTTMMMKRDNRGLAEIAKLVDAGLIVPRLSRVLTLDDAAQAQDLLQNGHPHGKVVLEI